MFPPRPSRPRRLSHNRPGHRRRGQGPAYMTIFRGRIGTGGASLTVPANPASASTVVRCRSLSLGAISRSAGGSPTPHSWWISLPSTSIRPAARKPQRLLGSVLPEPGFVAGRGNRGRFRFEVGKGNFLPVTREILARSRHGQVQLPNQSGLNHQALAGLRAGQYQAPTFEFLVADAPPGFPVSPVNFLEFPFLLKGEGTQSIGGTNIRRSYRSAPFPPSLP